MIAYKKSIAMHFCLELLGGLDEREEEKAARDKVGGVLSKSVVAELGASITALRSNMKSPKVWYN